MAIGDELYAWQVEEQTGEWSLVGALVPQVGYHMPLIHRRERIAREFEPIAREHARRTGQPLRLAKFTVDTVIQQEGKYE